MATLAMLHHVERLQPPTHRRCMSDPLKRGRAAQVQLLAAADGRLDINASESPKRIRPTAPPPPPAVVEAPPLDIECAICSGPMENPAVGGGCAHHFCLECLESWVKHKPSCPTCRAPVWAITRDAEFARFLGAESTDAPRASERPSSASSGKKSPVADPAAPREVRVHGPAGVTISHSSNGACVVERVVRGNGFHAAGVRAGDVVVAVNGTAVRDHETAICFIEQRCRAGDCVISYKPCTNLAVQLLHGTRSTLEPALSSLRRGLASAHASARRLSRPSPLAAVSTGRASPSEAALTAA